MNVAMVHYHLGSGGVSRVVANQVKAIDSVLGDEGTNRALVLHAGRCDPAFERLARSCRALSVSLHRIDGLGYGASADAAELADSIGAVLTAQGCSPVNTIVHAHNHSLGKNAALPGALRRLAEDQVPLLLQIHDFCEDFRPQSYRSFEAIGDVHGPEAIPRYLYPQAAHIHYAVLNRRDYGILSRAGFDGARLHWLPNPVDVEERHLSRSDAKSRLARHLGRRTLGRFVLYPVRGIRRKNVGEALLWSALVREDTLVGLTLAPLNPLERPAYERWKRLARELELPFAFELGQAAGIGFANLLAAADRLLTTSVAEGFGMVFLESWLARRTLVGRDLPEITGDFRTQGMRFDWLVDRLSIPVEWVGSRAFREATAAAYQRVLGAYGQTSVAPARLAHGIDGLIRDGLVDFAHLGARHQAKVVESTRGSAAARTRLRSLNPWMDDAVHAEEGAITLERNADIVRRCYSLRSVGARLLRLYEALVAGSRGQTLRPPEQPQRIRDGFLDINRFHPVLAEP